MWQIVGFIFLILVIVFLNLKERRSCKDGGWHSHVPGTQRRFFNRKWEYRPETEDEYADHQW